MVISTVLIGLWAENGRIHRISPYKVQKCKKMAWNSNLVPAKNSLSTCEIRRVRCRTAYGFISISVLCNLSDFDLWLRLSAKYFVARRSRSYGYAPSSRLVFCQNALPIFSNNLDYRVLNLILNLKLNLNLILHQKLM